MIERNVDGQFKKVLSKLGGGGLGLFPCPNSQKNVFLFFGGFFSTWRIFQSPKQSLSFR